MSLNEVITALQNSGVEYTFKVDNKDYNPDMLVGPWSGLAVEVYKDGNLYFLLSASNRSDETITGSSEGLKVDSPLPMRCAENTYYAKGFRRDGEGLTYGSVKEQLKEYTDIMSEKSGSVLDIHGNEYQGIELRIPIKTINAGGDTSITLTFLFKAEDGACVGAYSTVLLHY
ncbi:MAG: hypothetical protein IKK33_06465 [Lachnospiraceae bacterium]|nr:hypothetical protein [Lachnospiraceae bacterium]